MEEIGIVIAKELRVHKKKFKRANLNIHFSKSYKVNRSIK